MWKTLPSLPRIRFLHLSPRVSPHNFMFASLGLSVWIQNRPKLNYWCEKSHESQSSDEEFLKWFKKNTMFLPSWSLQVGYSKVLVPYRQRKYHLLCSLQGFISGPQVARIAVKNVMMGARHSVPAPKLINTILKTVLKVTGSLWRDAYIGGMC